MLVIILSVGLIIIGAIAYGLHLASRGNRLRHRILFLGLVGPVALGPAVFIWWSILAFDRVGNAYKHLDGNIRKNVTAAELQQWATNVLAHPEDHTLLTHYPSGLRNIRWVDNPDVIVCTRVDPGFVTIDWGHIRFMDDLRLRFEIGPTNFVGYGEKRKDGVYFRSEH